MSTSAAKLDEKTIEIVKSTVPVLGQHGEAITKRQPTENDRAEKFDKEGYIDLEWLQSILQDNIGDFYFCGPVSFMKAVNQALKDWNVPEEKIHFEFFGPADQLN